MKLVLAITFLAILISFFYSKQKTFLGIKKGLMMFLNILPVILNVLVIIGIFLFFVPQEVLINWLGKDSGVKGIIIAAILGSVSLLPGFISFPLSSFLLQNGASYMVVTIFITTLMMVGVLTLPIEIIYFSLKVSVLRNVLSFFGAIVIGLIVGVLM